MKKYKLNWGTGIIVSLIIFMIVVLLMTIIFMNQKVDLVTNNYYEKSQVYQEQIDSKERTISLSDKVGVEYHKNNISIIFPKAYCSLVNDGQLLFYRPSDSEKDFSIPLKLNSNGMQTLNVSEVEKGFWKLGIKWTMNKLNYQTEKSIIIQ